MVRNTCEITSEVTGHSQKICGRVSSFIPLNKKKIKKKKKKNIIVLGGYRCQQGKFTLFFIEIIGLDGFSIFSFFIPGSWEGKQWETCKGGKVVGRDA